ncbi:MAG: hypothetical protein ACI9BV_003972, partial [Rhodothermales bacterium]
DLVGKRKDRGHAHVRISGYRSANATGEHLIRSLNYDALH